MHWWSKGNVIWDRCEECGEDEVDGGECKYCGKQQTIPPETVTSPDGPAQAIEDIRADLREIMSRS